MVTDEGRLVTSHDNQSQPNVSGTENLDQGHPSIPSDPPVRNKAPSERVAQLIGKGCQLKCNMNGYAVTALFDTGAQFSLIDRAWRKKYLPHQVVHPLSELMGDCDLKITAANGEVFPDDGWMDGGNCQPSG